MKIQQCHSELVYYETIKTFHITKLETVRLLPTLFLNFFHFIQQQLWLHIPYLKFSYPKINEQGKTLVQLILVKATPSLELSKTGKRQIFFNYLAIFEISVKLQSAAQSNYINQIQMYLKSLVALCKKITSTSSPHSDGILCSFYLGKPHFK